MKLKIFLCSVCLLFISIVVALGLSSIYLSSYSERCGVENFYRLPKNSVDAVVIGPSSANYSWNTLLLWKDYGLVSAKYSIPALPASSLKYLIKEVYKTQKPKVLILYIDNVCYIPEKESDNLNYVTYNLPLIKNSFEKIQIINGIRKEFKLLLRETLPMFFPIIRFHERWKNLITTKSYYMKTLEVTRDRFFSRNNKIKIITREEMEKKVENCVDKERYKPENIAKVKDAQRKFLYEAMDYSKEKNIPLLLVAFPVGNYFYFKDQYYDRIEFNKPIFEYANKLGIPYLDFVNIDSINQMNIKKNDYMDYAHLNFCGAYKFQKAMVKVLKDDYGLQDRRGDKKYEYLYNQYNEYRSLINELYHIDLDEGFEKLCS